MNTFFNIQKTIKTNLSPESVLLKIENNIDKPKWYQVSVPKNNLEKIKCDSQKIELQVQTFYRKSNMPVFTCKVSQTPKGSEIEIKPKNINFYLFFIVVIWCLFLADSIFRVQYYTTFDVVGTITLAILAPLVSVGLIFFIHFWYIDTVVANLKKILKQ